MNLIATYAPGKREPDYLDPQMLKTLKGSGKYVLRAGNGLYGPFDSLEEAQAWAKAKAEEMKGAA